MLLYTVIDDSDGEELYATTDEDEAHDCADFYEHRYLGRRRMIIRVEELVEW